LISDYTFFKVHRAVKLHLNTPYDVIKYQGKTKTTISEFEGRQDRYTFTKFSKKCSNSSDAIEMCVANFMSIGNDWIYEDPENIYKNLAEYRKIKSALVYNIGNDLIALKAIIKVRLDSFQSLFSKTPSGNKAPLLQLYLSKKIIADTLIAIDRVYPFINDWIKTYENDPMLSKLIFMLSKYATFSSEHSQTTDKVKLFVNEFGVKTDTK